VCRCGHVDLTVRGGFQGGEEGSLANLMVPGKMVPGMGGAMDLVSGARRVIVAMEHCTKEGEPRILERCSLPLTAKSRVSMVVTELAVFSISHGEFILLETAPGISIETVREKTRARFAVAEEVGQMALGIQ